MSLKRYILRRARLLDYEKQDPTDNGCPRAICVFSGMDENGNEVVMLGRVEAGSGLSYRYPEYKKRLGEPQQYCDLTYYYNRSGRRIFEMDSYCTDD